MVSKNISFEKTNAGKPFKSVKFNVLEYCYIIVFLVVSPLYFQEKKIILFVEYSYFWKCFDKNYAYSKISLLLFYLCTVFCKFYTLARKIKGTSIKIYFILTLLSEATKKVIHWSQGQSGIVFT